MTKIKIRIPDEAVDAAMDAITDDVEISDHDLAEVILGGSHGIAVRDALGDAIREALIPLMR